MSRSGKWMMHYNRGDLIKDYKGRKGIIIGGNTEEERFVDVYIFGFGHKVMHDTRIELLSSKG
jgi:hypothetical protein